MMPTTRLTIVSPLKFESIVKLLFIVGFLLALPVIGKAQVSCRNFLGTTVAPITFDRAVSSLRLNKPKDEFETTVAYEARLALVDNTTPLIISKLIEDRKFLSYNVDENKLEINSYLFSNITFDPWKALYESKSGIEANVNNYVYGVYNRGVVISESNTNVGSYVAQNSYGAKVTIDRQYYTVKSIFESKELAHSKGIFIDQTAKEPIGTLIMSPGEAKKFRSTAKIAFVVIPKRPYVVRSTYKEGKATINHPFDSTISSVILIADLRCGLLMNAANLVMLSLETK